LKVLFVAILQRSQVFLCAAVWILVCSAVQAADPTPLVKKFCVRCHNADEHEADVDLTALKEQGKTFEGRKRWKKILHQLESEEMPPEDPLPTSAERAALITWAKAALEVDWSKVRDPGRVTIPRLTREEYANTIRDLIGVDVQPARTFSADGEGASGFNTDREALFLSPALMEKYLAAAETAVQGVAAVELHPLDLHIESEAMFMTETKETPRDYPDGFKGYVLNRGQMTLYQSVRFPADGYYTFTIRARGANGPAGARLRLNEATLGDYVVLSKTPQTLSQTFFVEAGSRQMTWNIENPSPATLARFRKALGEELAGPPPPTKPVKFKPLPKSANATVTREARKTAPLYKVHGKEPESAKKLIAALDSTAYGLQRPYEWLRLLGTTGDPREILRFKGYVAERTGGVVARKKALAAALGESLDDFNQRYYAANKERLTDNAALLKAVEDVTAKKIASLNFGGRKRGDSTKPGPIAIDWVKVSGPASIIQPRTPQVFVALPSDTRTPAEAAHAVLKSFLPRAFRRPVTSEEIARYQQLFDRSTERGDSFEESIRVSLMAVLVSPHFIYRHEFGPAQGEYRLDDYQLASRLSYFLWMSMPDAELFALAKSGRLSEPNVLAQQVERMLKDPKVRSFTTTFIGQWLGLAALGESVNPDAETFPQFTPELAQAMKLETILAFESMLQADRSALHLLDTDHTWLNETLAKHYSIDNVHGEQMRQVKLSNPERGGLLGMASVLTATSSPTRTSPVVRGKWVLETLLGETIPEPPADAGSLAADAGEARGKTLREELDQHRRNATCASCHDKIDPIGFGLEGFDAIGRLRTKEAGKPVDNLGVLPSGDSFQGAEQLKAVLLKKRRDDFLRNLSERLLQFALGRKLELYDVPTLMKISTSLEQHDNRAQTLITQIVLSYPFQYQSDQRQVE